MNHLNTAKRTQIIAALIEGNSINATCRMLGVGKHTVLRLLEDAGCACAAYHDANVGIFAWPAHNAMRCGRSSTRSRKM